MPSRVFTEYDAYLFDWDGNLACTLENWLDIQRGTLNKYGLKALDQEITARFGRWDFALDFGLDPALQDKFIEEIKEQVISRNIEVPLYDHAKDLLKQLTAQGKKIALVTSSVKQAINPALEHHGLLGLFDVVITGDIVTHHKPDPESLNLAMDKLNVSASNTLFLGDSDKDLLAAKNTGIGSLLFYPESHKLFYDKSYLLSLDPQFVVGSWAEVKW